MLQKMASIKTDHEIAGGTYGSTAESPVVTAFRTAVNFRSAHTGYRSIFNIKTMKAESFDPIPASPFPRSNAEIIS